ncbi:hypothetical_protein [Candidozyma auris]|uniref:hypothetical_protein n=1 Tax=Candidozyma auris TaxID=498019 RepID=UPI000D279B31|nr:hypothetical_protein [[Candida] auris]QEO21621.1 hypothetical_protein [[Candida] auris]GBL47878.1 hypothetical protein CAJCM15448_01520 [[Candida] auris]
MRWSVFAGLWCAAAAISPSGGYAPVKVSCPEGSLLRSGESISDAEQEWVQNRQPKANEALAQFLQKNLPEEDFDIENSSVRLATAFSGGGYRAMFVGAGELAAIDARSEDSPVAGILQSSTYIAGLSGGAWLLGSVAVQDWPEVVTLRDSMWNNTDANSIVDTSDFLGLAWAAITNSYSKLITHVRYWKNANGTGIGDDIKAKEDAGFYTTITDVWGRALAHQLFPSVDNYFDSVVWSDLQESSGFKNHTMPFPLVSALARRPDSLVYDLNSPVVEFNPLEMGSFDTSINSFAPTKYLGTRVFNGKTNETCIGGFDNAAFVVGTSSSLFNQFLDTLVCPNCDQLPGPVKWVVRSLLKRMSKQKEDIAIYNPNPFYGSEHAGSSNLSSSESLFLMDGGIGGEYLPLSSLMNSRRKVDTVLAFDNNPASWPDGASIVNAYRRSQTYEGQSVICPYVPGEETFAAHNLTARPVFFGCDAKNQSTLAKDGVTPPLVIYLANRPFEYFSNQSTLQLTYSDSEKKATIQNGYDIATQMNGTVDSDWGACVACAVVRRDQERQGIEQSDQCKKCFDKYCWDGSVYEGADYYRPVNYTIDGLTNSSMTLWGNNSIVVTKGNSGGGGILGFLWKGLKSLFSWL